MPGPVEVAGWTLDPDERTSLLRRFPPAFPDVVAHHVTLASRSFGPVDHPGTLGGEIAGRASDGVSIEALVVRIGGGTTRPDGGTFHITWSLDRRQGRRAKDSNVIIARFGWTPLVAPVRLRLLPARFVWPDQL